MKRCLFVINPISGGVDKKDFLQNLSDLCTKHSVVFQIYKTEGEKDEEKLSSQMKGFQPEVVVACGGDGTINLVSRVLRGKPVPLGIIPLGSANGLASELGIPDHLGTALEIILHGREKALDLLCINDQYYCLHLSDLGFNAVIIDNFEKSNLRGQFAYLLFFMKSLFSDHLRRYEFQFPETTFHQSAAMVVLANGRQYGFGVAVNPMGRLGDGFFEVCIFKKYPWYAFFGMLWRFVTGKLHTSRYYRVIRTDKVHIKVNRPVELQVDGEALGDCRELKAVISPAQFRVLLGEVDYSLFD